MSQSKVVPAKINQKEYLKKYLSGDANGDKKKKKKKDKTRTKPTVNVIDDDFHWSNLKGTTDEDLEAYAMGEDAPQIVGVIDDRPPELIAAEDYKKSMKWKSLANMQTDNNKLEAATKIGRSMETDRNDVNRRRYSSDISPPRKRDKSKDRGVIVKNERQTTPDLSPPRNNRSKRSASFDLSPPRSRTNIKRENSSDLSPPRQSTSRRNGSQTGADRISIKREKSDSDDLSPPRDRRRQSPDRHYDSKRRSNRRRSRSRSPPSHSRSHKYDDRRRRNHSRSRSPAGNRPIKRESRTMEKSKTTLDGKTAGLQDAKTLRVESDKFRKREDELFQQLSNELSGRTAEVVVRDRRTGRVRDIAMESEREQEKARKLKEREEVYTRWGKGLKQVEEYTARVESNLHEYSKPLARYADDQDLEEHLRRQERAGDPMLEYLKSKEKTRTDKVPSRPIYQGTYPENRFSIRPGYRWDGVDRSNGYEVKWFNVQSQKKAGEEEAYKYSTEDM